MRTGTTSQTPRAPRRTALALALSLALTACGGGTSLDSTHPKTPGATGSVTTSTVATSGLRLSLVVHDLPPPSKVASQAAVYVVWIKPLHGGLQKLGALAFSDTKGGDVVGKLDVDTTFHNFEIFVTPEPDAEHDTPTGERVLRGVVMQ